MQIAHGGFVNILVQAQILTNRTLAASFLIVATVALPSFHLHGQPPPASGIPEPQLKRLLRMAEGSSPGPSVETPEQSVEEFLAYLRRTSPIAAEKLSSGEMDESELESRLRVYLREKTALKPRPSAQPLQDVLSRVNDALSRMPESTALTSDKNMLSTRFLERLAERNRVAGESLANGSMSDQELESRLALFLTDYRAETEAAKIDPETASLPAIVDAFVSANFGRASDRPNSIAFEGSIQQGAFARKFAIFKKRPNKLRMHILDDGIVVAMLGFDGKRGWTQTAGEPAVAVIGKTEYELATLARFDSPLIGYTERGAQISRVKVSSADNVIVRVRESDGSESISTIDPKTMTEVAVILSSPGYDTDETRYGDHRKIGPLNFAFLQEQWVKGSVRATTRIATVTLDSGLLDGFFERPTSASKQFVFMDFMSGVRTLTARANSGAAASAGSRAINSSEKK